MAEAIGLVSSVVQVAGAGIQLSKALYEYADGVATADRRIRDIAKEIRLTSFVVEELGNVFKNDETATLISNNALETANETIQECSNVFVEIEVTLKKSKKNTFGRFMLPFRDAKVELLRSHIDKLKSTLQLLMQVLTHAYHVASRKLDHKAEAKEREEIRQLLQNRDNCTEKYERSLRSFDEFTSSSTDDTAQFATGNAVVPLLHNSGISVAAIGNTITATALASCVQHVRSLLNDLETLQENLHAKPNGDDHSRHYQSLTNSYFRARGSLDHVLGGSLQKAENVIDRGRRDNRGSNSDRHDDDFYADRGRFDSRSRNSRSRGGRKSEKWEQAAKAAIVADAVEAFRNRKIPGAWTGAKGQRVATAALGAAAIDALIDRDPEKHEKRHVAESALGGLLANRAVNGSRSRSRVYPAHSSDRPRSRSRSLFRRSRSLSRRHSWSSDGTPYDRDGNPATDHSRGTTPMPQARQLNLLFRSATNTAAAPIAATPEPSLLTYDQLNMDFTPFGDDIFADHQATSTNERDQPLQTVDGLNCEGSTSGPKLRGTINPLSGQDATDIRRYPRNALVPAMYAPWLSDRSASDSDYVRDNVRDYNLLKVHPHYDRNPVFNKDGDSNEPDPVPNFRSAKSSSYLRAYNPTVPLSLGDPSNPPSRSRGGMTSEEYMRYTASGGYASDDSDVEAAAGLAALRMAEEQKTADEARRRSGGAGLVSSYSRMPSPPLPQGPNQHAEQSDSDSNHAGVPVDLGLLGGNTPLSLYEENPDRTKFDEVELSVMAKALSLKGIAGTTVGASCGAAPNISPAGASSPTSTLFLFLGKAKVDKVDALLKEWTVILD